MTPEALVIPAADGVSLAATRFPPAATGGRPSTVVLLPATGVKRTFYERFATFLAQEGHEVLTFDYRGIGGSRPARLRGFRATMQGWARDADAVVDWARERPGERSVSAIGHSFGGQALALMSTTPVLDAAVTVAAQSGWWGHWPRPSRYRLALFWYLLLPVLSPLLGYFPAKRLGVSEDLPRGVALEWARWGRNRDYFSGEPKRTRPDFERLTAPLLAISFADDRFAPRPACDWLAARFVRAETTRWHLEPGDLGVAAIGHFPPFRESFRDSLWRRIAGWLVAARERGRSAARPGERAS